MKTAVSLPDDLYEQAEQLADRLGRSRSQIYRDALAEYLARHQPKTVTAALDEAVATAGNGADRWVTEAGRRALERSEW
jgi:predicted transcriptional regulator